jgi:hypothetical protein
MARRESIRRGRRVTALPYGPSVGHLFVVTFLIILPVYRATDNPRLAWLVGAAWCFVESATEIVGSFIGPWVRRNTPRAAMLAVMAGIAITLIAMSATFRIWEAPYVGLVVLGFLLVAWIGMKRLPGNLPAAVALLVIGSAIAWIGTALGWIPDGPAHMDSGAVSDAASALGFSFLTVIPLVAVVPILLYIGLIMGAQAFQAIPVRHAPAVVIALLPWLAAWATQLVDGALQAAGTSAEQVGFDVLAQQNVLYAGMQTLEQGVLLTSMILGAMTALSSIAGMARPPSSPLLEPFSPLSV